MGNRAWLYLQTEQDSDTPAIEVANVKNCLPTLWQVLLATSETTRANTTQRVFGDAGTEGLCAPAQAALARLTQLAAFLTERADDPAATYYRQLQGAVQWFGQLLAHDFGGAPCLFNADLDEISWLVDDDPDGFNRAVRQECNERWLALCERMAGNDVPGVLKLLHVADIKDEGSWGWRFGLGGLSHPYFADEEEQPEITFEAFEAEVALDNAHLGEGLYRFEADGLWGIRQGRSPGGPVLVAPGFDGIWAFEEGVCAVRKDGQFGLLDTSGRQVLPCVLDDIWSFAQGLAGAKRGAHIGYIDPQGNWVIAPRFDAIGDFSPANQAPACEGGCWGVIDRQGNWQVKPVWDDMDWDEDVYAWAPQRNERQGLIDTQGRLVLDAQYDGIWVSSYEVEAATQWADGSMRLVVRQGDDNGIVDADGQLLVPLAYHVFNSPAWRNGQACDAPPGHERRYVQMQRCIEHDDWEQWLESIYDVHDRREVLPFVHELLGMRWANAYGWLCAIAPEEPSEYCPEGVQIGIANADGSWLHEPVYGWVGEVGYLEDCADSIVGRWGRNAPVLAQRAEDGVMLVLHADGRVEPAPVQAGTFEA